MRPLELFTAAGILTALIWNYLLLGRGRFWEVGKLVLPAEGGRELSGILRP